MNAHTNVFETHADRVHRVYARAGPGFRETALPAKFIGDGCADPTRATAAGQNSTRRIPSTARMDDEDRDRPREVSPGYSQRDSFSPPRCLVVPIASTGAATGLREPARLRGFRLGQTPITRAEYSGFLADGRAPAPPWWDDPRFARAAQPVVGVTWHEAAGYCRWLCEVAGGRWRLPSGAEWEHAARGGLESPRTAWGETVPDGEIPAGPLDAPWDAGRGTPNGYGLLDIGTLVHEWCLDPVEPSRPGGPERRASRGGSWRHAIRWTAPSARSSLPPDYRYSDYGFRVLLEGDEDKD